MFLAFQLGFWAARIIRKSPVILVIDNLHIHHYLWAIVILIVMFLLVVIISLYLLPSKFWRKMLVTSAIIGAIDIGILLDEFEMLLKLQPNDYGSLKGLYIGITLFGLPVILLRWIATRDKKSNN